MLKIKQFLCYKVKSKVERTKTKTIVQFWTLWLEKDVGGLSAVTATIHNYRASLLSEKVAKERSRDHVGERAREELKEQVHLSNPFGNSREVVRFNMKIRGSPYAGLKEEDMTRHLSRKATEWRLKH